MWGVAVLSAIASITADPFTLAVSQLGSLSRLKAEPDWLRADFRSALTRPLQIDRKNGVIYGRVLAEKGPFKSKGRGEFDDASLDKIVELANGHVNGLKARFTHPGLSADGLGKFLGRDKNVRRDGDKVRGDLHLDKTALDVPPSGGKPLGHYCMDLAESDPGAFGSSLVLRADKKHRVNEDGTKQLDAAGDELPPLWRPTALHACDVVDDGDAVHNGFLSSDLPDGIVRQGFQLLSEQFRGCDPSTVRARMAAFTERFIELTSEDDMNANPPPPNPNPAPTPPNPQPPGRPTPAPPDNPTPPQKPATEPPSLAAERAELERLAAEVKADLETARAEQKKALAAAKQARINDFVDTRLRTGKIAPYEDDQSNPAKAHLNIRNRLLMLSTDATVRVCDELKSPLDVAMEAIDAGPVRPHGPKLDGYHGEGHEQPLTAAREQELLRHTPVGRAILKDRARAN